jgi:hypothetical protein
MSTAGAELHSFAFGEHLDALSERSLGYRLLAPAEPLPWSAEVESLARHLQNAPYPDHWPAAELFCSVILATGQRLVAVARYGLADHTPGHRRGGLELIGVVGPADLDVARARSIYEWLKQRRAKIQDLHGLGGVVPLSEAAAAPAPPLAPPDPTPVLPVRLWQAGALLFAATTPSDPDHRLNLLEQGAAGAWQWLPLVGADFPVTLYARRGPLVAWTPHLAGVALRLDNQPATAPAPPTRPVRSPLAAVGLLLLLLLMGLVAWNLAATLALSRQLAALGERSADRNPAAAAPLTAATSLERQGAGTASRDRFARALYALLQERGGRQDLAADRPALLARYERLAHDNRDLRLDESDDDGKVAVAAVSVLAQRSPDRVEDLVRQALAGKGFDPHLVQVACDLVREQLNADLKGGR